LPRITLALYGRTADEIIGYRAGKLVAMRTPGEPLAELQDRAWALGSAFMLEALYRPENRPSAVAVPSALPPVPAEQADPFALAGIGRRASREELERMGAIPVPPERLI
jgi:hypothetical protein